MITDKKRKIDNTVSIDYLQDLFTSEDIEELQEDLSRENILLETQVHGPQVIGGIEELFPQIRILLSPEIVHAIGTGVLTSGMYEVLKIFLQKVYLKMRARRLTKIQSGKPVEEVSPTIHFDIGPIHAVLPLEVEDEKYKYFVDKLFEYVSSESISETEYCFLNKENDQLEHYTRSEIAQKRYQDHREDI